MRQLRLIGLAAQAQGLLLQRGAAAASRRAVILAAAALFAAVALGLFQVAGWAALEEAYGGLTATLVLAFGNAVLALALVLVALQRQADPVADEARNLRQQCLGSLGEPSAGSSALLRWQPLAIDLALFAANRFMAHRDGR